MTIPAHRLKEIAALTHAMGMSVDEQRELVRGYRMIELVPEVVTDMREYASGDCRWVVSEARVLGWVERLDAAMAPPTEKTDV